MLYALLARAAPTAVVFRRGPSKQVLLIRWNTANDTFDEGQWLKARIYERRCDLSPDGELLLYFAASHRKPYYSWSAVSKPPYLTALALWPKGDAWGGGGHFVTRSRIALNHRENEMALAEDFVTPKWLAITPLGKHSGWGEDNPVWALRLEGDGWGLVSAGRLSEKDDANVMIRYDPPIVWEKPHPVAPEQYTLQMAILGIKQRNGPWYLTRHTVFSGANESHRLGITDWADWSASGDLLYSKAASLYRVEYSRGRLEQARELINFADRAFEARESPRAAQVWPKR